MLIGEKLILGPPTSVTRGTAATAPIATAARVQRRLHFSAARTASPPSRAAKLDCENVGKRPIQSTPIRAVSTPNVRRSLVHSSAAIASTATSARYLP